MRSLVSCAALAALVLPSVNYGSQPVAAPRTAAVIEVPVLVYHNVRPLQEGTRQRTFDIEPNVFEAQMLLLLYNGYTVVSLRTLVDALIGQSPLPKRAVVITFDDGWATQFQYAFPVLARLGFTATFFVFTSPICRDARFMTWHQLRQMLDAGMSIGSHSRTHPYLTRSDALTNEVTGSRRDIERELGCAPDFFAYPFGEFNEVLAAAVREAGYRAARGFGGGKMHRPEQLWNLHSIPVTANMSAFRRNLRVVAKQLPVQRERRSHAPISQISPNELYPPRIIRAATRRADSSRPPFVPDRIRRTHPQRQRIQARS